MTLGGAPGVGLNTAYSAGGLNVTGIVTATSFSGSGSGLSGIAVDKISEGNTEAEVVDTGSDGHFKVTTEGTERLRIIANGRVGIGSTIPSQKLDVAGNIAINQTTVFGSATAGLTTTSQTAILSGISTSIYRSVEYTIQAIEGTNFHVTKILAIHDGSSTYSSEYGTVFSNSSVATFDTDISGGNLRLLATGASASQTDYVINFVGTKV